MLLIANVKRVYVGLTFRFSKVGILWIIAAETSITRDLTGLLFLPVIIVLFLNEFTLKRRSYVSRGFAVTANSAHLIRRRTEPQLS